MFINYDIKIGFDNISAARIAEGKESTKDNPILVHLLSAFHRYLVNQVGYSISYFHIHSHHESGLLGHPWNEAADSLCSYLMNHDSFIQNPFRGPVKLSMAKSMDIYSLMINDYVQNCLNAPEGPPAIQRCLKPADVALHIDKVGLEANASGWSPCSVLCVQFLFSVFS